VSQSNLPRHPKVTAEDRLPGDLDRDALVERMIRVDHAGEYGAARIYAGQLAVLGRSPSGPVIQAMADQEKSHLATFDRLVVERRVRPTVLSPLWHAAGFALGAASALMGERAAMACTVAVEEVIGEHYGDQLDRLGDDESELRDTVAEFRADELGHRDTGLDQGAEQMAGYVPFTMAVKTGTRLAIWLSERF
jgi:ubiquinone biosynthesis monooxygenase Coq7